MKVLNSITKYPTKIEHFYKYILFSIIYLLLMQKLNPNKYCEQEINMTIFVYANEHNLHMYAMIQCMNMHRFW
jgi:hypothetical protein